MFAFKVFFLKIYMFIFKCITFMLPFKWPRIFEGSGSSLELCRHIAAQGHKKVLLVSDAMLVKLGLLDGMKAELAKHGVTLTIYDGVMPDPTIAQIEAGVSVLKANGCEAVLAVGGGSSIDAAKVIAARGKTNKPIAKMAGLFKVYFSGTLPLYAVPTTAGTGSEVTIAAVVSDPKLQSKLPIIDLKLMPVAAALDGQLMIGLPANITAATGMDALTHAVEAFISHNALQRTDKLAIQATQLIMANLVTAVNDGSNLAARQAMSKASNLAGMAFTQAGVGYVHAIAHNFGALYHTPHGLANAIVMPYVLDFSKSKCSRRLAELAKACNIGPTNGFDAELADAFIERIREMQRQFNIPQKLDALQRKDIPQIAAAALNEARFTYAVPRYLDREGCESLIRQMLVS
ncbi:iron-containing alcohol dehydrogenase [Paraglaciecola sp. 25GB23A]|uniref:iron-containing alcohol dehydrogenase n=1 Tax=Paraglaciecola sp. 25GB23A TaxID=3156068 RepID=UPI0032AEAF0F